MCVRACLRPSVCVCVRVHVTVLVLHTLLPVHSNIVHQLFKQSHKLLYYLYPFTCCTSILPYPPSTNTHIICTYNVTLSYSDLFCMCQSTVYSCYYTSCAGLSCEMCAQGYYRNRKGVCKPCDCNGNSESCVAATGVCFNCTGNTRGEHCEDCLPSESHQVCEHCCVRGRLELLSPCVAACQVISKEIL